MGEGFLAAARRRPALDFSGSRDIPDIVEALPCADRFKAASAEMAMKRRFCGLALTVLLLAPASAAHAATFGRPILDVPFVTTPEAVVTAMLKLAGTRPDDVVYDLGSGDGRIVIAAAQDRGARGVGFEIDPALVAEATARARRHGLADRVTFRQDDLFKADLRDATVVTLYLSPDLNRRLRPKLLRELRPGSRIVSHAFDMGDWAPTQTLQVRSNQGTHTLYLWVVPGR